MDLDDLLFRYFGSRDLTDVPSTALGAGVERMRVDLGLSNDPGQRFALWCLLHMLGSAPDLDVAFKEEADREAARNFMDLLDANSGSQGQARIDIAQYVKEEGRAAVGPGVT